MIEQFLAIAALVAMTLSAFALGMPLVRALRIGEGDRLETAVWSLGLGFVVAGLVLTGLGFTGILYRLVVVTLTLGGVFAGVWQLSGIWLRRAWRSALGDGAHGETVLPDGRFHAALPPSAAVRGGMICFAVVAGLGAFVSALAPPTAGDALCYHLELPKVFLAQHALVHQPFHDNATFPLLVEMWYLWGLALEGPVTAQLIHWLMGVLLALATVVLATPILSRAWSWMAGAIVLLIPGISNQMTAPLNDVALALMTVLALAAWRQAISDEGNSRWYIVAGLMAGGALGTKYLAILFAVPMLAAWLWRMWRQPATRAALFTGGATVAVIAVSVAGIWYVRAAWYYGNPVYPFFSGLVGATDIDSFHASKTPLGLSFSDIVGMPWHVTMHPEQFGGRGHQLGVMFLAMLPGLLLVRRLRGLGELLLLAAVYMVGWHLMRQNVRFLFPILPLLCIAVVWVWIELGRLTPAPRAVAASMVVLIMAFGAAVPVVRARDELAVAIGWETRENYLFRTEPTYEAAFVANRFTTANDRLLTQDYRAFYFNCQVTRETTYRRRTGYHDSHESPQAIVGRLREAGFRYVLLAENTSTEGIRYDATLRRLMDAALADQPGGDDSPVKCIHEYTFGDRDGGERRYRLLQLIGPDELASNDQ